MSVSVRKKKSLVLNVKPSVKMCVREQKDFITMASVELSWPVPMRAIGAQNLLTMPGGVTHSGYLHKKGGSQFSLMKWPLRYIILHKGCVYYFKTSTSPAPQGAFSLNGYNRVMRAAEETTSSNVFPFKIVHFSKKHRTWLFSAASEDERRKWMKSLRKEIDHYNDRRESNNQSDSDSDSDSFYGSIERPMDIKHTSDSPEDDYMMDDDDEDEEDYLKPDSPPQSKDRPPVPPPSYPPPLAPAPSPFQLRESLSFFKGLPPPVPLPNKTPASPFPQKPLPSIPPPSLHHQDSVDKGPPPPIPYAPHLQKPSSPSPPPLPMASLRKQMEQRMNTIPEARSERRGRRSPPSVSLHSPATLPICSQLKRSMLLDSAPLSGKPSPPLPPHVGGDSYCARVTRGGPQEPATLTPPPFPQPRAGLSVKPPILKPPSPSIKPPQPPSVKPAPPSVKPRGTSIQRPCPEGQSFRSSLVDPKPRVTLANHVVHEESDDDYENVQLPDSVFVETTETSSVEKLFKDTCMHPEDGLYCIRKSGTKTSKVLVVWDVSLNKARNYRLFSEESRVFLELDLTFPSLAALIEHYHAHPLPNHGSLCLQKPYGYTQPSCPLTFDL